ncbi:hypothetical protein CAQU_00565 [Corynebacterium aquilae DSM 44791]|uniref:tRNA adenosine deaminase n=1 Tax=Corynebacterium aquilae DSM 44791 TaxID=1431546 RepID=A0A1L7CDB0_9CORY|nr:hypothetical protein CAQU_00565 [Corynebacterium aquilae DSM 44791]
MVVWTDNEWAVNRFPIPNTVEEAASRVRALRAEGTAFAVVTIANEYFTIVRPTPRGIEVFISDGFAALDDDFGTDALAHIDELDSTEDAYDELDDEDDGDPYPIGNFGILADIGVAEPTLTVIADDPDMWATEQLAAIAEDLGCDTPWA